VIQDPESYEPMAELASYADSILNIRLALSEAGRPLGEFAQTFEAKHGITRWPVIIIPLSCYMASLLGHADKINLYSLTQYLRQNP
jgi:hypothetical protein